LPPKLDRRTPPADRGLRIDRISPKASRLLARPLVISREVYVLSCITVRPHLCGFDHGFRIHFAAAIPLLNFGNG